MNFRTATTAVFFACLALCPIQPAQAWHGYPPYGAWAYGSYPAFGHVHSRAVYRSHSHGWPASYGWGGYGNLGFTTTTRIHYRSHYRPYIAYRAPVVSYRIAYPRYVYPTYLIYSPITTYQYYTPVYSLPSYPTCMVPQSYSTSSSVLAAQCQGISPISNISGSAALSPPIHHTAIAANTNMSSKLVSTTDQSQIDSNVPTALLNAADAILQVGGYRQAATAYAQLAVRFGTSDQLLGRRFIAQVANGDLEQAEAILEIAELTGHAIVAQDLPDANLQELLKNQIEIDACAERIAARALSHTQDSLPLKSIATWLELSGQPERAGIFLARIEQISREQPLENSPLPTSPDIELVSFE